jgi:hypothetical protein
MYAAATKEKTMINMGIYLTQPHQGYRFNMNDGLAISLKTLSSVIPAKAGIQSFQGSLDAGSSPA